MKKGNKIRKFMTISSIFLFAILISVQAGVADEDPVPDCFSGVVTRLSVDKDNRLHVDLDEDRDGLADRFLIFDKWTTQQKKLLTTAKENGLPVIICRTLSANKEWILTSAEIADGPIEYYPGFDPTDEKPLSFVLMDTSKNIIIREIQK